MVEEQFRLECGRDALQQAIGHCRTGKPNFPDRAGVGRGEIGMAHQVMVERGHEIEVGDPLTADQPQSRGCIEARQANERAVDQRAIANSERIPIV